MPTKPVTYVSRITNLSDARYCAGMGVDMLGFVVDPGHVDYVSPANYQQMIGWVAGPRRVAEIRATESVGLDETLENYKPDLLHISADTLMKIGSPPLPIILEISYIEWLSSHKRLVSLIGDADHILITHLPWESVNQSAMPANVHPLLLAVESDTPSVRQLIKKTGAVGLALQGTRELTPGLKDYDHLSRILEELEG